MSVTLTISEETYRKLQTTAQIYGKKNVEKLLEDWSDEQFVERGKELARRKEVGDRIRKFQKQMGEKYGIMPDSTELIREDRNR